MRLTYTALVSIALFFGLTKAQSPYENTCNPAPVGEKDLEPGVVATYSCGSIHDKGAYAGEMKSTATPEDCAKECDKQSPGGPCSWHSGTCYFYNKGAGAAPWQNAITIEIWKDWNKLKAAYDQCQTDKAACLAAGWGGPPSTGVLPDKICESNTNLNEQIVTSGGRRYKVWCNAIKHGSNDLGAEIPVKNVNECIELCDQVSQEKCVRAITTANGTKCYLRSGGNKLTPDATGYHSFHLV